MLQRPTIHRCASIAIAVKHTNTGALQLQATGGQPTLLHGEATGVANGGGDIAPEGASTL